MQGAGGEGTIPAEGSLMTTRKVDGPDYKKIETTYLKIGTGNPATECLLCRLPGGD